MNGKNDVFLKMSRSLRAINSNFQLKNNNLTERIIVSLHIFSSAESSFAISVIAISLFSFVLYVRFIGYISITFMTDMYLLLPPVSYPCCCLFQHNNHPYLTMGSSYCMFDVDKDNASAFLVQIGVRFLDHMRCRCTWAGSRCHSYPRSSRIFMHQTVLHYSYPSLCIHPRLFWER